MVKSPPCCATPLDPDSVGQATISSATLWFVCTANLSREDSRCGVAVGVDALAMLSACTESSEQAPTRQPHARLRPGQGTQGSRLRHHYRPPSAFPLPPPLEQRLLLQFRGKSNVLAVRIYLVIMYCAPPILRRISTCSLAHAWGVLSDCAAPAFDVYRRLLTWPICVRMRQHTLLLLTPECADYLSWGDGGGRADWACPDVLDADSTSC